MSDPKVRLEVSRCPACGVHATDPSPWCFSCGAATEAQVLEVGEVVAYASTTTHLGGATRTLVFVDVLPDVRTLAEADRPVAIGERGRIEQVPHEDGLDRYRFHPTTEGLYS